VIGTSAHKSLCPSRFCVAHNPAQVLVSMADAERAGEPAIDGAIWCVGCGCVWVRDQRNMSHILGTLRKQGSFYSWRSAYHRAEPVKKAAADY
jgi:hypothetical protein